MAGAISRGIAPGRGWGPGGLGADRGWLRAGNRHRDSCASMMLEGMLNASRVKNVTLGEIQIWEVWSGWDGEISKNFPLACDGGEAIPGARVGRGGNMVRPCRPQGMAKCGHEINSCHAPWSRHSRLDRIGTAGELMSGSMFPENASCGCFCHRQRCFPGIPAQAGVPTPDGQPTRSVRGPKTTPIALVLIRILIHSHLAFRSWEGQVRRPAPNRFNSRGHLRGRSRRWSTGRNEPTGS